MKPIDFDAHYAEFAEQWIRENMGKYKTIDEMERHLPDAYVLFLNKPADWLDGETPGGYFAKMGDPKALIALLRAYEDERVDVPDLLLERIVDLGEGSIGPLMALAADEGAPVSLRVMALNMLIETGSREPMQICIALIDGRSEHDDVADVAAELIEGLGHEPVPLMLGRLDGASSAALMTYLDLLCNFPGDERIYTYAAQQFARDPEHRALYASYLGKLGDERAVPMLRKAMELSDINYLDYIEIRNAIERLTGESIDAGRDFSGDPYFESMRNA